jgi:hypothetical protein
MLQFKDIHLDRRIKKRAVMSASPVLKDGTAYVKLPDQPGVVFEFEMKGSKWRCVGMGRADHSAYRGLFPG